MSGAATKREELSEDKRSHSKVVGYFRVGKDVIFLNKALGEGHVEETVCFLALLLVPLVPLLGKIGCISVRWNEGNRGVLEVS